jgi:hypothetical protein
MKLEEERDLQLALLLSIDPELSVGPSGELPDTLEMMNRLLDIASKANLSDSSSDLSEQATILAERLQAIGLYIEETRNNGDCLFDALSFQDLRSKKLDTAWAKMIEHSTWMRAELNKAITTRYKDLGDAMTARERRDLAKPTGWGCGPVVAAAARLFSRNIRVISSSEGLERDVTLRPLTSAGQAKANARDPWVIGHMAEKHFVSTRKDPEDVKAPAEKKGKRAWLLAFPIAPDVDSVFSCRYGASFCPRYLYPRSLCCGQRAVFRGRQGQSSGQLHRRRGLVWR